MLPSSGIAGWAALTSGPKAGRWVSESKQTCHMSNVFPARMCHRLPRRRQQGETAAARAPAKAAPSKPPKDKLAISALPAKPSASRRPRKSRRWGGLAGILTIVQTVVHQTAVRCSHGILVVT